MKSLNFPGKKKNTPPPVPAPISRLETRRDELRTRFSELQWDLGGAAYEMAARDYFRLDVLASMAAKLQVVDAELAEIERMARLERAGAAGSCAGCGSLYARGAIYCWRCGRNLNEGRGTVVGPALTAPVVPSNSTEPPEPIIDPVVPKDDGRPQPKASDVPPVLDQDPIQTEILDAEPSPVADTEPPVDVDTEPTVDVEHESGRPTATRPVATHSARPEPRPSGYRPTPRSYQV